MRAPDSSVEEIANPGAAPAPDPAEQQRLARALRAQLATVTGGLAPDVYVGAWWDWYLNLAREPPKQLDLMQDALAKSFDNWTFALRAAAGEALVGVGAPAVGVVLAGLAGDVAQVGP